MKRFITSSNATEPKRRRNLTCNRHQHRPKMPQRPRFVARDMPGEELLAAECSLSENLPKADKLGPTLSRFDSWWSRMAHITRKRRRISARTANFVFLYKRRALH